jgi:hypothetical protein
MKGGFGVLGFQIMARSFRFRIIDIVWLGFRRWRQIIQRTIAKNVLFHTRGDPRILADLRPTPCSALYVREKERVLEALTL